MSLFLCMLLTQTVLANGLTGDNFVVVSTTSRPPAKNDNDDIQNRLKSLEAQVAQLQKQLEVGETHFQRKRLPRNCKEVQEKGHNVSDVYFIQPDIAPEPLLALCDMKTRGGGWTYILNRFSGSQDFGLQWQNYVDGFGHLDGEFWIGLDNIHYLTGSEINELLVELVDWDLNKVYALYSSFSVGNKREGYSLKLLKGYSGDAGDSLTYHFGMKFSTNDNDQDLWLDNCAAEAPAGWWFKECDVSLLTGKYLGKYLDTVDEFKGIYWKTFHGGRYSLKEARMMVRPA